MLPTPVPLASCRWNHSGLDPVSGRQARSISREWGKSGRLAVVDPSAIRRCAGLTRNAARVFPRGHTDVYVPTRAQPLRSTALRRIVLIKGIVPIRLTHHATRCSVLGWRCSGRVKAVIPEDAMCISVVVRNGGSVRALLGRVKVARRVRMSAVRPRRRLRVGVTTHLQVQAMPVPSLCHGGHRATRHTPIPSRLVLGRLSGHHPHPGYFCGATATATRSDALRNGVGAFAETTTSYGPTRA